MARQIDDLTNRRFGRLTVIQYVGKDSNGHSLWKCVCACGDSVIVRGCSLKSGATKSCGCLRKESTAERASTHHGKGTRLYNLWINMRSRCENPNNKAFRLYGAVGVAICPEWMQFENFRDWALQSGYQDGLTIERKNPFCNYEPSNCTWIPLSEQRKNRWRSTQWQN